MRSIFLSPGAWARGGRALAAALSLAAAGCAALPTPAERPDSNAFDDVASTSLAQVAAASRPGDAAERSGFRLLAEGDDALEARIALIRRAEKSIDVQYYLIANDRTGRQFLAELSAAAARGVRVRVLVDDLYALREGALFAALAAQPGFAVRLFNPLPVRGGNFVSRVALSAHEFARINHRMHNKLLIADNSFAITGGRNIADEYFDRSGSAHFIDMDLLSAGDVVASLSALFDEFWNSPYAYPAESLLRARQREAAARGESPAPTPAEDVDADGDADPLAPGSLAGELAAGRVALRFAAARVVADRPAQIDDNDRARPDGPVMRAHLDLLASARSRVLVATPYFVPGHGGLAAMRAGRARNVPITVLTNSLATTDEPLVHFGYARYRHGLLAMGVELQELMPTLEPMPAGEGGERHGASLGRLHAKLVVVDDRWVSIGSMNMDRRSARSNTESAIVIDDTVLAREAAEFLERGSVGASYTLRLGEGKKVEWVGGEGDSVLRKEPRRAGGRGIKPRLASLFVSEEML
jgi:phosphatidylserine/phosphatidylglycerophosphate/cardiolipin synthase-like enzyme